VILKFPDCGTNKGLSYLILSSSKEIVPMKRCSWRRWIMERSRDCHGVESEIALTASAFTVRCGSRPSSRHLGGPRTPADANKASLWSPRFKSRPLKHVPTRLCQNQYANVTGPAPGVMMAPSTCSEVMHMHALKYGPHHTHTPLLRHIVKPISRLNGRAINTSQGSR